MECSKVGMHVIRCSLSLCVPLENIRYMDVL